VVLVDTSVWIQVFRRRRPLDLEAVVDFDSIATCPPVIQEVLQGFDDQRAFAAAREAMLALPCVESPLSLPVLEEAVDLYRRARRAGLTIRSGVDCLIAACALRNALAVLHRDRDFAALARVAPLAVLDAPP
jgi:predicted nucleic acid-binding protein